jgi:chemotaxis protein MotB
MSLASKRVNFLVRDSQVSAKMLFLVPTVLICGFLTQRLASFSGTENPVEGAVPVHKIEAPETPESAPNGASAESVPSVKDRVGAAVRSRILGIQGVARIEPDSGNKGLSVEFKSDEFFKIGTAVMEERSLSSVRELAILLKETFGGSRIEIEGHTDSSPVIKQRRMFPSNWELSAARAASLLHVFEATGFPKENLKVSGYGDSRPVGESESGNRRIVVRVTPSAGEGGRQ